MNIERLFNPKSVAIIGASSNIDKLGGIVLNNLVKGKFQGKIYPINPKGGEIFNIEVIHRINELPEGVDLAILALDAETSVTVVKDIGNKKIPFAIIFAGGYAEIGNYELEKKLEDECENHGVNLIGPNCMGLWNHYSNLNASFMNILPPQVGKVSFVSQSGSLIAVAIYEKIRMGKFISVGNAINIHFQHLIPFLEQDPNTTIIALYIESLKDGRDFIKSIKDCSKPVIAIRAGISESGQRSIASHTASLAGNSAIYNSLFKNYGILQIESFELLSTLSRAFELMLLPKNNKVLAISNAGGATCLFSDACSEYGIETSPLPDKLKNKLREVWPQQAPLNNPLDLTVTGWTEQNISNILNILLDTSIHDYGSIVFMPVIAPYQDAETDAKFAIEFSKKSKIPFMTCLLSGDKVKPIIPLLDKSEIPYCLSLRETAYVLSLIIEWNKKRQLSKL